MLPFAVGPLVACPPPDPDWNYYVDVVLGIQDPPCAFVLVNKDYDNGTTHTKDYEHFAPPDIPIGYEDNDLVLFSTYVGFKPGLYPELNKAGAGYGTVTLSWAGDDTFRVYARYNKELGPQGPGSWPQASNDVQYEQDYHTGWLEGLSSGVTELSLNFYYNTTLLGEICVTHTVPVYVVYQEIQPVAYLAQDTQRPLSVVFGPELPGQFWWTTDGKVRYVADGYNNRMYTSGQDVIIRGHTRSNAIDDAVLTVNFNVDQQQLGRAFSVQNTEPLTVFQLELTGGGEREVNWDDKNGNTKSDRRDSGIPSSGVLVYHAHPDFLEMTLRLRPDGLSTGTTDLTRKGEADRGVFWKSANRSGGKQEDETFPNSVLSDPNNPKRFWHEAIYPNTLTTSETYAGSITLTAESTLDGSTAETSSTINQYLDANVTYYTLPHEQEYTGTPTTETVHVGSMAGATTEVVMAYDFFLPRNTAPLPINGSGVLKTPVVVDGLQYPYIRYAAGSGYYVATEVAPYYYHDPLDWRATAKYVEGGNTGKAAPDLPSDIHVPLLWEGIIAARPSVADWLGPYITEHRRVNDLGDGRSAAGPKPKWLDIFVPYVPKSGRQAPYDTVTFVEFLYALPHLNPIRVEWREPIP